MPSALPAGTLRVEGFSSHSETACMLMHVSTIITSRLPPAGALLEVPFLRSWPSVGVFRVCSPAPRPGMSLSYFEKHPGGIKEHVALTIVTF